MPSPCVRCTRPVCRVPLHLCRSTASTCSPPSSPPPATSLSAVSVSLRLLRFVFWIPRVSDILCCPSPSVWPASLSTVPLRPVCVVAENGVSPSFVASWASIARCRLHLPYPLVHQGTPRLCLCLGGCQRHRIPFLSSK